MTVLQHLLVLVAITTLVLQFSAAKRDKSNEKTSNEAVVQLEHGGKIRGVTMNSYEGRPFFAFRGIPFAEPPVGDLRFRAPVAKAPWPAETPLDTTKDGNVCPQFDLFTKTFQGNEDCLILNVYTPELPEAEDEEDEEDDSLPVLVWFYGGGFVKGASHSSFYGPKYLMDQRVVLVTVNYRIGAFGFLSTADEASPGNYGLLDQSLSLQWVKENIAHFMGDPSRVTIFGESAGGASIDYHLLSPASVDLFHGAIAMSGSPLCQWAFGKPHQVTHWANRLATDVGCPTATTDELIRCLRGISAKSIVDTTESYSVYGLFPFVFNPTVDGHFLLDEPLSILSSGKIPNKVPVIHGITSREGVTLYAVAAQNQTATDKTFATNMIAYMIDNLAQEREAANEAYNSYFSAIDKQDETAAKITLIDAISHGMMDSCHYQTVQLLSKAGVPTYAYSFNYQSQGPDIFGDIFNVEKNLGVGHGAELAYLFRFELPGIPLPALVPNDEYIMSNLTRLFTNFAARGNPTPYTRSKKFKVDWPKTKESPITMLNIDQEPTISTYDPSTDSFYALWTKRVPELIRGKQEKVQKATKEEL